MGIVKKQRKKRVFHKKRWDKATIELEKELVRDYGIRRKREIRKFELILKKIKEQAKTFNKQRMTEDDPEVREFLTGLIEDGFLKVENPKIDDVLDISLRDILDRRLTSIVYKKKLARTPRQARQFIVHGHIAIDGKKVDTPNLLVPVVLEDKIDYFEKSPLANEEHPIRQDEFIKEELEKEEIEGGEKRAPQEDAEDFDVLEEEADDEEVDEVEE